MTWIILRYFPFLIPFKILYQDPFIIAIPHPIPSYTTHILILPRIYLPDFLALDIQSETGKKFVQSVYKALKVLLADIEQENIQLVINGGNYQDVKLLHMHLIENTHKINDLEVIETENTNAGLLKLFSQAKINIQSTECSAYRLIILFYKNKIQLQSQIVSDSN